MSDLIDRQAAINATLTFLVEYCGAALTFLVEYCGAEFDEDMQKMLCERLDALPPAQPGWISVTERLPTENNFYLVWMPFTPEGHHITVAEWCGSYWNIKTPIMAWMPLPTPYREGGT